MKKFSESAINKENEQSSTILGGKTNARSLSNVLKEIRDSKTSIQVKILLPIAESCLRARINDISVKIVLDTGSDVNIISKQLTETQNIFNVYHDSFVLCGQEQSVFSHEMTKLSLIHNQSLPVEIDAYIIDKMFEYIIIGQYDIAKILKPEALDNGRPYLDTIYGRAYYGDKSENVKNRSICFSGNTCRNLGSKFQRTATVVTIESSIQSINFQASTNGLSFPALLDSGAFITEIHQSLVQPKDIFTIDNTMHIKTLRGVHSTNKMTKVILTLKPFPSIEIFAFINENLTESHKGMLIGCNEISKVTKPEKLYNGRAYFDTIYGKVYLNNAHLQKENYYNQYFQNCQQSLNSNIVNNLRPDSTSSTNVPTCWYHLNFGRKARKCIQPCKFHNNPETNRRDA